MAYGTIVGVEGTLVLCRHLNGSLSFRVQLALPLMSAIDVALGLRFLSLVPWLLTSPQILPKLRSLQSSAPVSLCHPGAADIRAGSRFSNGIMGGLGL